MDEDCVGQRTAATTQREQWSKPVDQRRREVFLGIALVGVLATAGVAAFVTSGSDTDTISTTDAQESALSDINASLDAQTAADTATAPDEPFVELIDVELAGLADPDPAGESEAPDQDRADGGCTIASLSLRLGADGDGVACLQNALLDAGYFSGTADGEFSQSTFDAVMKYQLDEDFFVDGVAGRETAIGLSIWPDEESLVNRTPRPAAGATDLWGVELSPVGSAGDDAPPLPENSGSGYRVVYDRAGQRTWAVDANERIIRSWLVSGSTYANEVPGNHEVYSRSELSTAWNGKAYLPNMIRWLKTERGAIGFHGIPTKVSTGEVYQTSDELGTRLSGGCQRQHNLDAAFLWGFAPIGTPVIVT
ncbi:MAG: peptidoglycan hydrolase-like protein with peptidoglycan-binding domain [Candidatus Aldehydirespiratoraceae bacterium]|jgi:peptidoglycan hydrolase-like protein with peptidoglycan-binding domain